MTNTAIQQAKWVRFFSARNRIEANFVADHPSFPAHDHAFVEIEMVVSGTCQQRSSLGEARVRAGDVYLFRPGAWHAFERAEGLSLYNCCFDSSLLTRELSWLVDHPSLGALLWSIPLAPAQRGMAALRLPPREVALCRGVLEKLRRLADTDPAVTFADQVGLLLQFLGALARQVPKACVRAGGERPHAAVAAALRLIDESPAEAWTLASLAGRVRVEPTYFVRLFHKTVGLPPMAYLAGRRVELAAGLLRGTGLPVSEVGALVGWPDANHFSRRFRAKFGLSPTRYRVRSAGTKIP